MVTQFELIDPDGNVLANGEIDGTLYRVFSQEFLGGYKEFQDTAEIFAMYEGCAIQPEMFQTPARTHQLSLFENKTDT